MALSHSDLMRLLQALRTAGGVETIRVLCERVLQELIEAYVHGVSPRSVDNLVKALGADSGISTSEVSRICVSRTPNSTRSRNGPRTQGCIVFALWPV